ncbi:hypothetical protein WOLCODRAFT_149744 [Wolfiporia cocos MD-104 SS10]|uniref:Uncharacterized protein n=1 Tax=Wolfiporia cocos (strain MD-104) TaxID=742152 RepID=A0A2H3JBT8_WOLCO|nr:hypothetical protein WOLCODRAFT_149744 [Wolfiporia cocos MD-104 SS10]
MLLSEDAAQKAYFVRITAKYHHDHPTPLPPALLADRILSAETVAKIVDKVRIEPEWVKDHFHLLPEGIERCHIWAMYKKYQWALHLLLIFEEADWLLCQLHNIIFKDYKFSAKKDSQTVVNQVRNFRRFYDAFFEAILYDDITNKELRESERDANAIRKYLRHGKVLDGSVRSAVCGLAALKYTFPTL